MTPHQRQLAAAVLIALAVGWWVGSPPSKPDPDRPVLKWIAKVAKNLLWVAVFLEEPPDEIRTVRSEIGDDGYVQVDHGRGW